MGGRGGAGGTTLDMDADVANMTHDEAAIGAVIGVGVGGGGTRPLDEPANIIGVVVSCCVPADAVAAVAAAAAAAFILASRLCIKLSKIIFFCSNVSPTPESTKLELFCGDDDDDDDKI